MQAKAARILAELGAHAAHLLAKLVAPLVERLFVAHGLVLGLLFGEGGGSALGVSMVARDAVELGALCHPTATALFARREEGGRRLKRCRHGVDAHARDVAFELGERIPFDAILGDVYRGAELEQRRRN